MKTIEEIEKFFNEKYDDIDQWDWFYVSQFQNISEEFIKTVKTNA